MSQHTFDYDRSYLPSAPVVEIVVNGYDAAVSSISCTTLVDSGADGTMHPVDLLNQLSAQFVGAKRMRGVTDHSTIVDMFVVQITIGEIVVDGIRAVGRSVGSECIIGRDILNQLQVTLDGFALEVRVWDYND